MTYFRMVDKDKRQTLSLIAAGIAAINTPAYAFAKSIKTQASINHSHNAYNGTKLLPAVDFTVSTLGRDSAITTITNNSNTVVTVTKLYPQLIEHNNQTFNINAAIGSSGITLKPSQKRMLIAYNTATIALA